MTYHPENDGSHIYTAYSEDVLKAAEKALRLSRTKYYLSLLGKGAFNMVASYGMTPSMYAELHSKDK